MELDGASVVRVESAEQILVSWPFEPLPCRTRAASRSGCVRSALERVERARHRGDVLPLDDWSPRFVTPRDYGALDAPAPELVRTGVLCPG
ncbi:hypothetical protein [Streptomyces sp. NBC_00459]|uniref:hypothetical protein n=1 Tax=Streptomyces sp. NBC_00459 TaxID=2975749 RepID=UPI002E18CE54